MRSSDLQGTGTGLPCHSFGEQGKQLLAPFLPLLSDLSWPPLPWWVPRLGKFLSKLPSLPEAALQAS